MPVIKHFISGVENSGKYIGFCSLGVSCQPTENSQLREHFKMSQELTGVLISKINALSDASRVLKKDDILLAFDGSPIANDGTGELSVHLSGIYSSIYVLIDFGGFSSLPQSREDNI